MSVITLLTTIKAPAERCFLLSLSVDLHKNSTSHTGEKAVAGVTTGIMNLNDIVTWQAKHFGIVQKLTTKITKYERPGYFVDEMTQGAFKKIYHQHIFKEEVKGITTMTDVFEMEAPLGILGYLAEKLFLINYMKRFLETRNNFIKEIAEGEEWRNYVNDTM